jgi:hypothetical protein
MRVIILSIAMLSFTGAPAHLNPAARTVCCHGCGSKYCKKATCGSKYQASPCHGCWKTCDPKSK